MHNPYEVLGVSQDADKRDIMRAKPKALRGKQYTMHEVMAAEKQLLDSSKRLAADFMFPAKYKTKRPVVIQLDFKASETSFKDIDPAAFDTLRQPHEEYN